MEYTYRKNAMINKEANRTKAENEIFYLMSTKKNSGVMEVMKSVDENYNNQELISYLLESEGNNLKGELLPESIGVADNERVWWIANESVIESTKRALEDTPAFVIYNDPSWGAEV